MVVLSRRALFKQAADSASALRPDLLVEVQGEILLPAIATLLRASPQEFKLLKTGLHHGWNAASWWPKTQ